jgi:predicted aspartyl protease
VHKTAVSSVILLACCIMGCAKTVWVKPGASQQDFTTDQYNCEKDARQSGYFGTGLVGAINMQNFYDSCMNSRGWYSQKLAPAASAAPTPTLPAPRNYSSYDNRAVCRMATLWDGTGWDTSSTYTSAVTEAQSRGLTLDQCRSLATALLSSTVPSTPVASKYSSYDSRALCRLATLGNSWDTGSSYAGAVAEAQSRGLTLEQCRSLTTASLSSTEPVAASPSPPTTTAPVSKQSIAMHQEGGTYVVPVLINATITLDFIVDSGAADVSIPADVVLTLMRSGSVRSSDFLGTKTYTLADGSTVPSSTFRIKSLKVGDRVIENVTVSVVDVKGSLLLGQSFLGRLKSWSIDNAKHALVLE